MFTVDSLFCKPSDVVISNIPSADECPTFADIVRREWSEYCQSDEYFEEIEAMHEMGEFDSIGDA